MRETPKAAQAFALYVGLGPKRSLSKLADLMVQQTFYKSSMVAFRMVGEWSRVHGWQDRIKDAASAQSLALLERAAEYDADSFAKTSELIHDRLDWTTSHDLDGLLKMRESVRPKSTKGSTLDVNITLTIRQEAEKEAARLTALGIPTTADDLLISEEVRG